MIAIKRQTALLTMLTVTFFLLTVIRPVMAQVPPTSEETDITLIQATLIAARIEQPGLPRYQISGKDAECIQSAFGGTSGLSAKVIKVMPMTPVTGSEPQKTVGWVMDIGDSWSALFQIEKIERVYHKGVYKTWPLIEFRGGKISFLEDGIQVSEGLEARVSRHAYVFGKEKGWISSKDEKK